MDLVVAFLLVKVFTLLLHFLPENLFDFCIPMVARWWSSLGCAWPEVLTLGPLPNLNKAYY